MGNTASVPKVSIIINKQDSKQNDTSDINKSVIHTMLTNTIVANVDIPVDDKNVVIIEIGKKNIVQEEP